MAKMGLGKLGLPTTTFRRKNRWMFHIKDISGDDQDGMNVLPPSASARPQMAFKEAEVQHLSESIWYPTKPDWKPINLKLYDINCPSENVVLKWIKKWYNAKDGQWIPSDSWDMPLKQTGNLDIYTGCGDVMETWVYDNCYPSNIQFGELDMAGGEILTIDLTLRYDRAYIK